MHTDNMAPINDLEIRFVMRKGVSFVLSTLNYAKLSGQYRTFTTKIDSVEISRDIYSALQGPHWKVAVLEETNTFDRE